MSSSTALAAAAAYRGNTLFVQYSTAANPLGTLFTLNPLPSSGSPSLSSSQPNSSTLSIQQQTLFVNGVNPPSAALGPTIPGGASMISTATMDPVTGAYRHELLLSLNLPTPFMYRLTPQSSSAGDGLSPSSGPSAWTVSDRTQKIRADVNRVWLASGKTNGLPEGSAVFSFTTSEGLNSIDKLDVSTSVTGVGLQGWPYQSTFINNNAGPKIVRLTDDTFWDVLVVGNCASSPGTCMMLINDNGRLPITTDMPYDPSSCIAVANGSVISATPSSIWTFPYSNPSVAGWINSQPPGIQPNLPSPILTCTIANSKLYAFLQGDNRMPAVRTVDLTSPNWDWQTVQLVQPSSNSTNMPFSPAGSSSTNGKKSVSAAIIAVIVVAVIALLLLLLLAFLWRQRRNKKKAGFELGHVEKAIVAPAPTIALAPTHAGYQQQAVNFMPAHAVPIAATPGSRSASMGTDKQELSEYLQTTSTLPPPRVSRAWSNDTIVTPVYSAPSQQYGHAAYPSSGVQQISGTAAAAAPGGSPYAHIPGPLLHRNVLVSNVQELNNQEQASRPGSAAASSHSSTPTSSNAFLQPEVADSSSAADPRFQSLLSPGLANAQLILQQSQASPQPHPQHLIRPDDSYYRP